MKLLLVTEFFPSGNDQTAFTGGVEARTFFTVSHLIKSHTVDVYARSKRNVTANVISLFTRFVFQLKAFVKVLTAEYDVVEASNVTVYLPVGLASALRNKPRVAWIPDILGNDWFNHFGLVTGTIGFIQEKLALLIPWTQYIALSESTREKLIAQGIDKTKITVIYGGVEYEQCRALRVKKEKVPTVVFAGRLVSYKRVDDLIKALPLIKERVPEARLKVIGTGPKLDELKQLAKRLNVEESVSFLGFLESHEAVLIEIKSSQVFSLPSTIEGFGLVTIEAMACGVAYVNSDIKTTKEITGNGQGGLLFKVGNVDDLADKIIALLLDKTLYIHKTKEGFAWAKRYDWNVITEQTEKVFKKVYEEKI